MCFRNSHWQGTFESFDHAVFGLQDAHKTAVQGQKNLPKRALCLYRHATRPEAGEPSIIRDYDCGGDLERYSGYPKFMSYDCR